MILSSIGLSWLNVKGLAYVSILVDGGSVAARDELLKSLLAFLRKITLVGVSTWMEPIACLFPDSLPVISIAKRNRTTLFFLAERRLSHATRIARKKQTSTLRAQVMASSY